MLFQLTLPSLPEAGGRAGLLHLELCLRRSFPEEWGAPAPVSYTWDQQTAGLSGRGALGPDLCRDS